jgi:DNA-binding NarL/FixJ family response regulator
VKEEYKILIVDDHKIFREGLAFVISQIKGFEVAGEASDGFTFLEMIDYLIVDIVLMDISMPGIDGIDATVQALQKHPDLKIIALSMFCDKEYYTKMIQAGVSGYLLKESGKDELSRALNAVTAGEKYFSQKLLQNIILRAKNFQDPTNKIIGMEINLSMRESEILNLICKGMSNAQISEELSLSLRTLEGYKSDLMSKAGVKDSLGLAIFALKNQLIDI